MSASSLFSIEQIRDFQKKNRSIDITQQTEAQLELYIDIMAEYANGN